MKTDYTRTLYRIDMWPFKKKSKPVYTLHHQILNQGVHLILLIDGVEECNWILKKEHLKPYIKTQEKVITKSSIWHVLGLMPTKDSAKVKAAFKKMSMVYHPDHGGSTQAFQGLVEARDLALQKCNG